MLQLAAIGTGSWVGMQDGVGVTQPLRIPGISRPQEKNKFTNGGSGCLEAVRDAATPLFEDVRSSIVEIEDIPVGR